MKLEIAVVIHVVDEPASSKLDCILQLLHNLEKKTMNKLDALEKQVNANADVEQSALILIQGLAQRISDAGADETKLSALTSELKASADNLAAAVAANTVASAPVEATDPATPA